MSYPDIDVNLPDPFKGHPTYVSVPLTRTGHVEGPTIIGGTTTTTVTLTAGQYLAPIIISPLATAAVNVTLPTALQLESAFGSYRQVQVGDVFTVQVINLGSAAGAATFTGGTGPLTVTIPIAGAAGTNVHYLCILFTATSATVPNNPAPAFTLY